MILSINFLGQMGAKQRLVYDSKNGRLLVVLTSLVYSFRNTFFPNFRRFTFNSVIHTMCSLSGKCPVTLINLGFIIDLTESSAKFVSMSSFLTELKKRNEKALTFAATKKFRRILQQ
jgi:hypothetical protein